MLFVTLTKQKYLLTNQICNNFRKNLYNKVNTMYKNENNIHDEINNTDKQIKKAIEKIFENTGLKLNEINVKIKINNEKYLKKKILFYKFLFL